MQLMISHDHRESALANAWKKLLDRASQGSITTWFSSDRKVDGGIGLGEWLPILERQLALSQYTMALITRQSVDRPWIIWECGMAKKEHNNRAVIPVRYGIDMNEFVGPLANFQSYAGTDPGSVKRLCRLLTKEAGISLSDTDLTLLVEEYLAEIDDYLRHTEPVLELFGKAFHRPDKSLEGAWQCRWYDAEGKLWEEDRIDLYMDADRVRIVGAGAKTHLYPMEGKLSSMRYLCLTYWSIASVAACGTVLLRVNANGTRMKGEWAGHTARNYDEDDLQIMRGTVECEKRVLPARPERRADP